MHSERRKASWRAYQQRRRSAIAALIATWRLSCVRCGHRVLAALDLHHRDAREKDFALSAANSRSVRAIERELTKCDVLCANCHLEEHASRTSVMSQGGSRAVVEWRRRTKARLLELHGGRCIRCGYAGHVAALVFHHRDPNTKSFAISVDGVPRAWSRLVEGRRNAICSARTAIGQCTRRKGQLDVALSAAVTEGPFFEDFTVGATFRSSIGRTVTQADNIQFSLLTNNANEIHFNAHYAAQTEFKRPLVNSFLTLATVAGMMVPETSRWGFALGVGEVTLPNPLFEGDTLYADTEVLEARASRSRPGWGIVTVRQRGIKQDGTIVLIAKRTFMVPTRANAPKPHFPEPRE